MIRKFFIFFPLIISLLILVYVGMFYRKPMIRLFISADKQAQEFEKKSQLDEALKTYENKLSIGAIYFKEAKFKEALKEYEGSNVKEAFYNRGNTLVMLGKYPEAIENYQLALEVDAQYGQAKDNLEIAKARQEELDKYKGTSAGATEIGADKIVYDNKSKKGDNFEVNEEVKSKGEQQWLDRLETSPSGFLKSKFSYQYHMQKKAKK